MTSTAAPAAAETRNCLRCGRKLTAGTEPYGPRCARKVRQAAITEARADFTPSQQAAADELIRDGGIVPTNRDGVFRSVSSKGDETYLTHSAICSCRAGLQGRRCYHVLAARILVLSARPARNSLMKVA